jgi:hypothetical protein
VSGAGEALAHAGADLRDDPDDGQRADPRDGGQQVPGGGGGGQTGRRGM